MGATESKNFLQFHTGYGYKLEFNDPCASRMLIRLALRSWNETYGRGLLRLHRVVLSLTSFARALSTAIFLTELDDKRTVEEVLKHNITYESKADVSLMVNPFSRSSLCPSTRNPVQSNGCCYEGIWSSQGSHLRRAIVQWEVLGHGQKLARAHPQWTLLRSP